MVDVVVSVESVDRSGKTGTRMPSSETLSSSERAGHWLAGAGLRPTRQRLALAELLIGDGHNRHVTAESLHPEVPSNDLEPQPGTDEQKGIHHVVEFCSLHSTNGHVGPGVEVDGVLVPQ